MGLSTREDFAFGDIMTGSKLPVTMSPNASSFVLQMHSGAIFLPSNASVHQFLKYGVLNHCTLVLHVRSHKQRKIKMMVVSMDGASNQRGNITLGRYVTFEGTLR